MNPFVALLFTLLLATPAWAQQRPAPAEQPRAAPKVDARSMLRALEDAFAAVADRVTPAVVHVSTVPKKAATGAPEEAPERFKEFFGEEFYERYFRRRPREDARATGSGVLVDPKGYILTNNHVIENAQEIIVRLSDQRKFTAKLVGRDPKTDIAVLKIDAPRPLPAAELGDSDHLRVGQWAIAIGNPFGLDRTMTVGIISATARTRVGVTQYDNFIQTDASINPDNSGGPLLNIDGKVIGINTAIVAAGQGIGFSIPINQAKDVMQQLITRGKVVRGLLGIVIQDVTDQLAGSFGVKEREGVLVAEVMKGSPAEAAGLKAGEMPADEPLVAEAPGNDEWGLNVESLTGDAALRLDLPVSRGLLVTDVLPGSPAEKAGLRRGDVILEISRRSADEPATLFKALSALKPGESILIYVHRAGGSGSGANQYLTMERSRQR